MKYFIGTKFIEGFNKPLFGKRRHFIDLISIAIVAEDGREYYAIGNEWNYKDADKLVQENVIHKLPLKLREKETISSFRQRCKIGEDTFDQYKWLNGKSSMQIATEIHSFINPHIDVNNGDYFDELLYDQKYWELHSMEIFAPNKACPYFVCRNKPEFYGYYADYDWVLFCSLFGRMIDLPTGFPMYCIDLKQRLDEYSKVYSSSGQKEDKERNLRYVKDMKNYPVQNNEHNALVDARWNKKLFEFLSTI